MLADRVAFVLTALLAATTSAQQPQPAALDLEAIAKVLDPGELPAVLSTIPTAKVQRCLAVTKSVPSTELEEFAPWGTSDTPIACTVACALFDRIGDRRETAATLLAEIHACLALATRGKSNEFVRSIGGVAQNPTRDWIEATGLAARQRARGLGARLLREHPDAPEVGAFLVAVSDEIEGYRRATLTTEGLRRLGPAATSYDLLWEADQALRDLDFGHAAAALALAAKAPAPTSLPGRRIVATIRLELQQRLARAQSEALLSKANGLEGTIAHLRMLLAANRDLAVAESRQLVADDVAHALPFSILANEYFSQPEAPSWIDKAMQRPGRDFSLALALACKLVGPSMRDRPTTDTEKKALMDKYRAMLDTCDEVVADEASPDATIYRWVRRELQWGKTPEPRLPQDLPSAVALQASEPDVPEAYAILLATTLHTKDRTKAREVVLKPIPASLASLHDIAQHRAETYIWLDMMDDRAPIQSELDLVLGDLERVQGDAQEANYLRGVRTWWEATRPGASRDLATVARNHLRKAQRRFGTPGLWRSACALAVLDHHLGDKVDIGELMRRREQESGTDLPNSAIALMSLVLATAEKDKDALTSIKPLLPRIEGGASQGAIHSAMVPAYARLGEASAARQSAQSALDAISLTSDTELPSHRGVLRMRRFAISFKTGSRPEFEIVLKQQLWVVPQLPDREHLRRIADGK